MVAILTVVLTSTATDALERRMHMTEASLVTPRDWARLSVGLISRGKNRDDYVAMDSGVPPILSAASDRVILISPRPHPIGPRATDHEAGPQKSRRRHNLLGFNRFRNQVEVTTRPWIPASTRRHDTAAAERARTALEEDL